MHLRTIRLRGFKSFPDPVEVRLEPGVAVVVGPNGSGKSNIADALIWAAGSLAPSELRAEKPDDVLFNGSAARAVAACGTPNADRRTSATVVSVLRTCISGQFGSAASSRSSTPSS